MTLAGLQLSVGFGDARENKKMIRKALLDSISENKGCLPSDLMIVNLTLAFFNGILAVVAFSQLLRIHMRDRNKGWTRQKVLHFMIGSSNLGYFIYFISTHIATCKRWLCWSRVCGFILMAYPKILFLAAFLLLLSFWVDLCHQANDEEDEYDENNIQKALLEKSKNNCGLTGSSNTDGHRICCLIQSLHVGSRQKIVIVVVALVFIFMMSCAVVIWIGAGKNPIDSSILAQVYEDFLSTTVLLLGGALGCYGLLLFSKLRKVRSEKASSDMWKVAGLAVVSVVCFTSSALVALLTDIPLYYHWRLRKTFGVRALMFVILYYLIGSLVPSAFLLWITRELPPPTTSQTEQSRTIFIRRATDDTNHRRQWAAATSSKNQASRASPI